MDDAQKDTLQKIIDGAGSEGMVAAAKKAMQFLEDEHLMYKLHLKCSLLGVYEGNRSGMGIDLAHLQQLMKSIAAVGYVDHGGRICVELDSTSPESENTRRFNRKIALESGGRLPPADNIMYATLSGSHLNMASRAIAHRCTDALSIDAIPSGWRDAIMEGVSWLVLKRTAWIEFPALADLLCQAGNSIQAISKAEDEIQLLRKILQSIRCFKGVPKWVDVSGEVLRSRPRCSASGAGIFGFALRFGGCSMIDAKRAMTNREVLQRAHKAMDVLSAWDKCTSDFDARAATSRLECELVAIVLDKKNRKHATLLEAARVSLQKEFPSAIMPDTWNEAAPEKKPAAKAKSSATVFRQYDAKGKLTNPKEVMTSLGFNIGVKVQRGDSVGVITAIKDNDDVQLTLEEDGKHKQVFPSLEDMKKRNLSLDRSISLPVLRNVQKLQAGDELCLHVVKKERTLGEPLREAPAKRLRR
ncbi:unnamed protein product [Durusdinium trenchii]|uniref:Uncharacterized protein n=1 Tax=Durusdinium trenchii TaxID=1381693 RepID=A0ABP0HPX0_9DINO